MLLPHNSEKLEDLKFLVSCQFDTRHPLILPNDCGSDGKRLIDFTTTSMPEKVTHLETALQQRDAYKNIIHVMRNEGEYYQGQNTCSWVGEQLRALEYGV
jgi:hypothetical protein